MYLIFISKFFLKSWKLRHATATYGLRMKDPHPRYSVSMDEHTVCSLTGFLLSVRANIFCLLTKYSIIYNCGLYLLPFQFARTHFYRKDESCHIAENTVSTLGFLICVFFLTYRCYQIWVIRSINLSWEIVFPELSVRDSCLLQNLDTYFSLLVVCVCLLFLMMEGWLFFFSFIQGSWIIRPIWSPL